LNFSIKTNLRRFKAFFIMVGEKELEKYFNEKQMEKKIF
jgi:hypothetical protein